MKKIITMLLALTLALCLVACGGAPSGGSSNGNAVSPEGPASTPEISTPASENSTEPAETEDPEGRAALGNVRVVYFSNSGNTQEVAQIISERTGGDLAEIQRAEPYEDLQTEAEEEINGGVQPAITVDVDSVEPYDTIFVGYPIWWDEAPAMIATFLAENDFDGKLIVPFCTSASDSIDNSLHIFEELTDGATIAQGLTANDLDDIQPWLDGLEAR